MTIALVTGGTSGIGASFARALAARGHDLVLVARDQQRLEETAAELAVQHNVAVETLVADLDQPEEVAKVVSRLESSERPIGILVNNAGFGVQTKITEPGIETHQRAINVMIQAVLLLSAAAGRTMKTRGEGIIINVSSTAGFVSIGTYSAIKAWVTTFSEALANELHGTGVRVTALCPGWVRTEFHDRAEIGTSKIPHWLWLDSDELVADCLNDVMHGRVVSIPSKRYRTLMFAARHAPRSAVRAASRRVSSTRH